MNTISEFRVMPTELANKLHNLTIEKIEFGFKMAGANTYRVEFKELNAKYDFNYEFVLSSKKVLKVGDKVKVSLVDQNDYDNGEVSEKRLRAFTK